MRHRIASIPPPRQCRRRGSIPRKNNAVSAKPESFHAEPCAVEALVCIVEIVRVLETGELPETWICDGFREHVGGLLGVPCP
jgi:hypothetical protein